MPAPSGMFVNNLARQIAKFEADKAQFQGILESFNKEKAEFERDRSKMLDLIEDSRRMRENAVNFLTFVKRESEKL